MNKEKILQATREYVQRELENESSGHDWWHIYRVTQLAIRMAEREGADQFICELSALLHDIADEKLNESEEIGLQKVRSWLGQVQVEEALIKQILEIISAMSFKGGNRPPMSSLEGRIVQDADRLDAIGAIGIARTFAYSGAKGQLIYDPKLPPREAMSAEEYRSGKSTAINHFYEKLLKLKELMNTETGKSIAEERHQRLVTYLEDFYLEWNGKG
ncbi:HD domain-containing protein [Caldalkalibacillus mannanilyticus]|uniref:HD domain-containing protein n=1 Tax=Caldalkalibacillus mannanilyticus TaxID=1418 RepID=UPI000469B741|nr:HD domain-containing protein [Caldalkalibacillus mannanilyticus]